MNSVNFKTVKNYTKHFFKGFLFAFFFFAQVKVHAADSLIQAIQKAVRSQEPTQEIVILNTEKGFVPASVRVKKGVAYKIHVVNLNMKEKNVSFLMDSFSQSHNTVYGVEKIFNIQPQVEGVYSYQCPETGQQGQLVVVPTAGRSVASTDAD